MLEWRSSLAHRLAGGGHDGADGRRALRLGEVRGRHLAQLAVFGGQDAALGEALRPVVQGDLPSAVGTSARHARCRIYALARGQYWIATPDADLLRRLAHAVAAASGSVTPLSNGRTCIVVQGAAARALLAKGIALDLHPGVFGIGHFALTGLHHTGILLERSGEERYELTVLRTFAATIWDWLIDAALPIGYDVHVEEE